MDSRATTLNCDICHRQHHPQRLPFFCAMDARNTLYEGRIANARVLMEMDELEQRINKLLLDSQPDSKTTGPAGDNRFYVENCASEEHKARDRTEQIIVAAEKLQREVDSAKQEIKERKAAMARRKADLASASQGIDVRRRKTFDETKQATRNVKYMWNRDHMTMAQYRAGLCAEVAKLYRLQRFRRGSPARFEYKIGGIDLVDLYHLNTTTPENISASLAHTAHLLWLASHYLAVRLPAEITLPHNDYPRPTIFSLSSSYNHGQVAFPGTYPAPPDSLDRQFSYVPHPRPLFLDKGLPTFSKEDPAAYNSFIEGVCLLAYNIVWLCRTQGIPMGDTANLDEFSSIGRNLHNLLVGSSFQRNHLGQPLIPDVNVSSPGQNGTTSSNGETPHDLSKATPRMGAWSHGTTHTFLGSAAGQDLTKSFKLPSPIKLADKLKAYLVNQTHPAHLEWEMVNQNDVGPNDLDDGVFVGGTPQSSTKTPTYGLESYMSVNTAKSGETGTPQVPGSNTAGNDRWTKLRSR